MALTAGAMLSVCAFGRAGRGASDVAFRAGSIEQQMTRMLAAASQPVLTEVTYARAHVCAFKAVPASAASHDALRQQPADALTD